MSSTLAQRRGSIAAIHGVRFGIHGGGRASRHACGLARIAAVGVTRLRLAAGWRESRACGRGFRRAVCCGGERRASGGGGERRSGAARRGDDLRLVVGWRESRACGACGRGFGELFAAGASGGGGEQRSGAAWRRFAVGGGMARIAGVRGVQAGLSASCLRRGRAKGERRRGRAARRGGDENGGRAGAWLSGAGAGAVYTPRLM
jgi:hypothetical protein